jgi:hypothetical protein
VIDMALIGDGQFGHFPFGRPNTSRPMRLPTGTVAALVVGVYPSAFHVSWNPPADRDPRPNGERRHPFIASLAVDVEPVVFWDGSTPSPGDVLDRWKIAVGFDEEYGTVNVGNNGPSGAGLLDDVLEPLALEADNVAFTDAVPWFFVKDGRGSQGEAMRERFGPIATGIGAVLGSLPARPSAAQLVKLAAGVQRRDSLREELAAAGAPLVITLGQEALDAVRAVVDRCEGVQSRLVPNKQYGARGQIEVGQRRMELLPLVHPGFQRQTSANGEWGVRLTQWANARS